MKHHLSACLLLAVVISAPAAADPELSFPVECSIGRNCFIVDYVDTEMSGGAKDFTCGTLTYDGSRSTDIRLKNVVAMDVGVMVVAAAPGTVLRTRDGMDDISVKIRGEDAIWNREAGNGVVIDHGDGWVTQYSHMKKGSIAVKPGQAVEAGTPLGQIGLSGNTIVPLLGFEVRHDDKPVDPFTGAAPGAGCGLENHPLWKTELPYIPTGLLSDGFALERPDIEAARRGAYAATELTNLSPALVYWVDVFGLQAGDQMRVTLTGPDGAILGENKASIDRPKAQYYIFTGTRHPSGGWKTGFYVGRLEVVRGDQIVVVQRNQIALP